MSENWDIQIQQLYTQEYDKLVRVAYRMTGDVEAAQDFVQDAFLMVLFRREEFSVHPSLGGWLMVTLRNLIQNDRKRACRHDIPLEEAVGLPADDMPQSLDEILPVQLPEKDRELLIWRFEQRMSYREIGDRKGLSEGACRARVFRAIARCRDLLTEESSSAT